MLPEAPQDDMVSVSQGCDHGGKAALVRFRVLALPPIAELRMMRYLNSSSFRQIRQLSS